MHPTFSPFSLAEDDLEPLILLNLHLWGAEITSTHYHAWLLSVAADQTLGFMRARQALSN